MNERRLLVRPLDVAAMNWGNAALAVTVVGCVCWAIGFGGTVVVLIAGAREAFGVCGGFIFAGSILAFTGMFVAHREGWT